MNTNNKLDAAAFGRILATHAALFAAVAVAINGAGEAGEAATEAKGSVSQALREAAKVTHDAGEPVTETRAAMLASLAGLGVKPGSVKASGNHFAGFRAMLADGLDIETGKEGKPYTAPDAQAYIASADVKRMKAIRTAISKAVGTAAGKQDGDKTGDAEARLLTIAEAIGADVSEYRAMLGEREGQREAG